MRFEISAKTNELLIYGPIGPDFWAEKSIEARDIVDALADMSGPLTVRINSQGGSMDDGIAIATAIRNYPADTVIHVDGVAHSAAAFIAMAGDTIRMDASAVMMIHGPSVDPGYSNRSQLIDADAALTAYGDAMTGAFRRGDRITAETVAAWIDDGKNHYFTAAEALTVGLIDEITSPLSVAAISLTEGRSAVMSTPEDKTVIIRAERERLSAIQGIMSLDLIVNALAPDKFRAIEAMAIKDGSTPDQLREKLFSEISTMVSEPIAARSAAEGGISGSGRVEAGRDAGEKAAEGMSDALEVRMGLDKDGETRRRVAQSEYMGMTCTEMARRSLEAKGGRVRGMNRLDIVGAALGAGRRGGYSIRADRGITHTPSDFPALLENALNKAVLRGWEEAEETWRMIARPGSIPDFRPAPRTALGEYPTLPQIDPNTGEFRYITVGDRKEELVLGTYGSIIGITRAALVNDDLQQFGRLGVKQGRAASRTVGDLVYFVLTSNPTMLQDGQPLFDAAHENIAADAGPPTIDRLDEMSVILGLQTDPDDNAHGLNLPLQRVFVPLELRTTARVLLRSQYDPDNVGNSRADNPFQGEFDVVADPRLSQNSATEWYGSTNPDNFDLIEVGFLEGNQEPFMETKEGWTVDGVEMKVRIDAAAAPLDFRTIVRNPGV